jgi:transcriptional regulator with XRE-family HTH domain
MVCLKFHNNHKGDIMTNHRDFKAERVRRGITQKQLAEMIGATAWRLCMFENHGLALPDAAREKLFKILGLGTASASQR